VVEQQDNTTVRIVKGGREQTVHVNRVRPLLERDEADSECESWSPPLFHDHSQDDITERLEASENTEPPGSSSNGTGQQLRTTRSGRVVKPVDYYGY